MGWRRTRGESERNSCRVELRGKYHKKAGKILVE